MDIILGLGGSLLGLAAFLAALMGPARLVSRYLDRPRDPLQERDH